jgi:hypothetical protein
VVGVGRGIPTAWYPKTTVCCRSPLGGEGSRHERGGDALGGATVRSGRTQRITNVALRPGQDINFCEERPFARPAGLPEQVRLRPPSTLTSADTGSYAGLLRVWSSLLPISFSLHRRLPAPRTHAPEIHRGPMGESHPPFGHSAGPRGAIGFPIPYSGHAAPAAIPGRWQYPATDRGACHFDPRACMLRAGGVSTSLGGIT